MHILRDCLTQYLANVAMLSVATGSVGFELGFFSTLAQVVKWMELGRLWGTPEQQGQQ